MLRLIKILAPASRQGELEVLLERESHVEYWSEDVSGGRICFHVLTSTEGSTSILDGIADRLTGSGEFRIVLLPVEAVLPELRLEKEKPESGENAEPSSDKKGKAKHPRISREELHNDLSGGAEITNQFIVTVLLSAVVAAVGLLKDQVAVLVGAMVIAPLLGPNMSLALATTLGDTKLGGRALKANMVGLSLTLLVAIGIGLFVPVDILSGQIQSRTAVDLGDLILALAAGGAGALAVANGAQVSLVGVMVAVALMPPLVNMGLLLGAGHSSLAWGAALLVSANVVCVNLAGVVAFLAMGVRPRTWWEADRARAATRRAIFVWTFLLVFLLLVLYFMGLN